MALRNTLLPFVVLLSAVLSAQDWALFPLGQRSYFQRTGSGNERVDMFLMDSIRTSGNAQVLLFDAKQIIGGASQCNAQQTLQNVSTWIQGNCSPSHIDSLVFHNDTVFYRIFGSTTPFYFLPLAEPGQSWTVTSTYSLNTWQQITITCTGVAEEVLWGVPDSVKTFSMMSNGLNPGQVPVSAFTMRLSKTFGLIEFVPFRLFLIHPSYVSFTSTRCIGLERPDVALGFRPPHFSDFFHLQAGDIRLWRDTQVNNFPFPPVVRYRRDSLVASSITPDTVLYTYLSWTQNADMSITGPWLHTDTITRLGTGPIVESPPCGLSIGLDGYVLNETSWTIWKHNDMELLYGTSGMDTLVRASFGSDATYLDTSDCSAWETTDLGLGMRFDTRAGLVEECMYFNGPAQWCIELIGWRIDGEQEGPIALGVSELEPSAGPPILYPNPANDRIHLVGDRATGPLLCEVLDATGKVVMTAVHRMEGIPVNGLPNGAYILRIHFDGGPIHARFMKQ